jgi:hypothetical protein
MDDWTDEGLDAYEAVAIIHGAAWHLDRVASMMEERPLVVLVNGRAATVEEADAALKRGDRPLKIACWEEP